MLARDKPRVCELQDDGSYAGERMKPLDMDVIEGMVETARRIAHDYEHGFEGIGMKGFVRIVGLGCIVGSEYT